MGLKYLHSGTDGAFRRALVESLAQQSDVQRSATCRASPGASHVLKPTSLCAHPAKTMQRIRLESGGGTLLTCHRTEDQGGSPSSEAGMEPSSRATVVASSERMSERLSRMLPPLFGAGDTMAGASVSSVPTSTIDGEVEPRTSTPTASS
mmetsp:Transcript_53024/g.118985  ORF Transcript_53024/g.118985 Transcript_53024/m.118985 type:complete len:150 (+) Transcript_53024:499-948(+)